MSSADTVIRPENRQRVPVVEWAAILALVLVAAFSRFYRLDQRVMSHDEVNHLTPSYDLFVGRGYRYDPMSHGPLQFHLMAWSYFLLGDSDYSARVPHALFGVATILFVVLAFRRYLGRTGAWAAAIMLLISPYMLFYTRYARNEAFTVLWGALTLYSILRYLETGDHAVLLLHTLTYALHACDKVTSYMFAGEEALFLGGYLLWRLWRPAWRDETQKRSFRLGVTVAVSAALLLLTLQPAPVAAKAALALVAAGGLALAAFSLVRGVGLDVIRRERAFHLLVMLVTLFLPLTGALPLKLFGFNPLDTSSAGITRAFAVVVPLTALAAGIGLWWSRKWLQHAAVFWLLFVTFYTTFFTNGGGLPTGLMGGLGYWMEQQGVNRGGQPWFFYAFLQVPLYEFLPLTATWLAAAIGRYRGLWRARPDLPFASAAEPAESPQTGERRPVPTLALLLYWSASSLFVFTLAGEKMPWLTTNIALPMILAGAWAIGFLVERADWPSLWRRKVWLVSLILLVWWAAVRGVVSNRPFQTGLDGLQATTGFLVSALMALLLARWLVLHLADWKLRDVLRLVSLLALVWLAVLTVRASVRASFINQDSGKEYLVYAHAAADPNYVLDQIEDLSRRTTGGLDIVIAYDNDVRYPYWWSLRHYPNRIDVGENPTRDIRRAAVIVVGDASYAKIEPIVDDDYVQHDYMRMVWPNQDYFQLGWSPVLSAHGRPTGIDLLDYPMGLWQDVRPFFTDAGVRNAIWQIAYHRDYTAYATLHKRTGFTDKDWEPGGRMRMYVRKDIAAQAYSTGELEPPAPSAFDKAEVRLEPDRIIGGEGSQPGQLKSPRGIATAADGSLYVADSQNHRIQHLSASGAVLHTWGTFGDGRGALNEPWGVAVAADGTVYVADTWNHRVQVFTATGEFLRTWGRYGLGNARDGFWGPRGIAVDGEGRVFVTDTGNKRIVVFDSQGNYLTEFGGVGAALGQMDEPVGIAIDSGGRAYVADTWNQRVQVFQPQGEGFVPVHSWDVDGWDGQSLDNKPYLTVVPVGHVVVTDPDGRRVIQYTSRGEVARWWSTLSDSAGSAMPSGIASDSIGGVWVSDASGHRLLHYVAN